VLSSLEPPSVDRVTLWVWAKSEFVNARPSPANRPCSCRYSESAHRTLPLGTKVRVENLSNGRSTTVEINDRGPFTQGRLIDASRAAAEQLAFIDGGVTRVRISTREEGDSLPACETN